MDFDFLTEGGAPYLGGPIRELPAFLASRWWEAKEHAVTIGYQQKGIRLRAGRQAEKFVQRMMCDQPFLSFAGGSYSQLNRSMRLSGQKKRKKKRGKKAETQTSDGRTELVGKWARSEKGSIELVETGKGSGSG
jgi:hypothetical protein